MEINYLAKINEFCQDKRNAVHRYKMEFSRFKNNGTDDKPLFHGKLTIKNWIPKYTVENSKNPTRTINSSKKILSKYLLQKVLQKTDPLYEKYLENPAISFNNNNNSDDCDSLDEYFSEENFEPKKEIPPPQKLLSIENVIGNKHSQEEKRLSFEHNIKRFSNINEFLVYIFEKSIRQRIEGTYLSLPNPSSKNITETFTEPRLAFSEWRGIIAFDCKCDLTEHDIGIYKTFVYMKKYQIMSLSNSIIVILDQRSFSQFNFIELTSLGNTLIFLSDSVFEKKSEESHLNSRIKIQNEVKKNEEEFEMDLNYDIITLMETFNRGQGKKARKIADMLGVTKKEVNHHLYRLEDNNVVYKKVDKKGVFWFLSK